MDPLVELIKLQFMPLSIILSPKIHLVRILGPELVDEELRLIEYLGQEEEVEEVLLGLFIVQLEIKFDLLIIVIIFFRRICQIKFDLGLLDYYFMNRNLV